MEHLDSISLAGREALAIARQAWLLRHDTAAPVLPSNVREGEDVVVLLHGLFASAGVLRPLRAALERNRGVHTVALSYFPGPGVEELAARLGEVVRKLPSTARIHLVGHSLGGVVARYYALHTKDPRIVQTISLASPFAGIARAGWLGFSGARDLAVGSPMLRSIVHDSARSRLPHLSILASGDTLVKPPLAHTLPGSELQVVGHVGHNSLLFEVETARILVDRVLRLHAAGDLAEERGHAEPR